MIEKIKYLKRIFLFTILGFIFLDTQAQSGVHNYFSPTNGGYIQVGFNNGFILFRIASPEYQFSTMNYMGSKDGFNYYGTQSFQVAITKDSGQVFVISGNNTICYNYCGPVQINNPYQNSYNQNNTNQGGYSSRCPWCNGSGRITKNDHVTQYGLNNVTVDVKCSECGIIYCSTYTNHYHLNCSKCGGTGVIRN